MALETSTISGLQWLIEFFGRRQRLKFLKSRIHEYPFCKVTTVGLIQWGANFSKMTSPCRPIYFKMNGAYNTLRTICSIICSIMLFIIYSIKTNFYLRIR